MFNITAPTPFAIGAMHVPNRVTGRKGAFLNNLLAMAQAWRRGPALIVGDTNTGRIGIDEESPAFDRFEDDWMVAMQKARWRDAFRHIHSKELAYTWYSPTKRNGFRLDEGFVNDRLIKRMTDVCHMWGAVEGSSRRDVLSDHAALILDFND